MNLKNILLLVCFLGSLTSGAQSNLLNARTPDEIGKKTTAQLVSDNDKPLAYGFVDDRDVLMGKTVWEYIDLNERINFPLYFPTDSSQIGNNRRSLFDVLMKGIKSGKITQVYADSYFTSKKTLTEINGNLKRIDTLPQGADIINSDPDLYNPTIIPAKPAVLNRNGVVIKAATEAQIIPAKQQLDLQYIDTKEITSFNVVGYRIVGRWYFDKRQGELKYRLLGICPVTPEAKYVREETTDYIDLFWIYFPDARDILNTSYAFNDKNSAMPISFDRLLNSRRFNAVIYQEENVYGDRSIENYMKDNSQMQLLEAERVKDKIRDFEQDMWNY